MPSSPDSRSKDFLKFIGLEEHALFRFRNKRAVNSNHVVEINQAINDRRSKREHQQTVSSESGVRRSIIRVNRFLDNRNIQTLNFYCAYRFDYLFD